MRKREQFGSVALRLGYITKKQLEDALEVQRLEDEGGKKHRLLGLIMLELGYLSTTDLIDVLQRIDEAQKRREGRGE